MDNSPVPLTNRCISTQFTNQYYRKVAETEPMSEFSEALDKDKTNRENKAYTILSKMKDGTYLTTGGEYLVRLGYDNEVNVFPNPAYNDRFGITDTSNSIKVTEELSKELAALRALAKSKLDKERADWDKVRAINALETLEEEA